jgi:hypothetical protein
MAKCVRLLAQIRPNGVPNSKVHRKAARRGMRAYHTRWRATTKDEESLPSCVRANRELFVYRALMMKRADLERGCLQPGTEHPESKLANRRKLALEPVFKHNAIPAQRMIR